MIAFPPEIVDLFDPLLRNKSLQSNIRFFYTQWLRFYCDCCNKYQRDPFHVVSLRLLLKKLQDKLQSEQHQQQAHQAVSLFYAIQFGNNHS